MAEERPSQAWAPGQQIKLRSLAPEFDSGQHEIYVRHLEEAVLDKRNRNIALTGRYGAGKSSVLDDFEKKNKKTTVRISINTLGPDEDDEDLTNRIQKELVKQLVYRLKPGKIRRSRFARPKPLTKGRAFLHALFASVVSLGLLWVLGVRSAPGWPDAAADLSGYLWRAGMLFGLVLASLWAARWFIGDRIVSEVTTAGTKIALGEGPTTYFDSFLDEIVAFFDTVRPKYVLFEDLDRFEDPQIFDSLRELNTLINASANWRTKDDPLRFIYAIKDSLFEQLGKEPESKDGEGKLKEGEAKASDGQDSPKAKANPRRDIAAEAVRRANRTKFFEIVVPMVPFISHRNARDLLAEELVKLDLPEGTVSRMLLDLVARHTTDMRLMKNICNEFVVFAEHLLWTQNPAPGMTADHLFALVAYKNFHLADFEAISQRTSTLDVLERLHRDEVRALVDGLQKQRRQKLRTGEQREWKTATAAALGDRLLDIKNLLPTPNGWSYYQVRIGSQSFAIDAVGTVDFWERVAATKSFAVVQQHSLSAVAFSAAQVLRIFPEIESGLWQEPAPDDLDSILRQYDQDIAMLRGADFDQLARYERLPKGRVSFDRHIEEVLESGLARDLVRRGFITRNYAEYSAVFYGKFVGVDVAFFYNHSVQPNEMYLDHQFTSETAINNLLEQVPADFTSTVSVLNVQVASFLLKERPKDAAELVEYIVTHDSPQVLAFLESFFNAPEAPHELLIRGLTQHPWPSVFEFVAGHPAVPYEEMRVRLLDEALLHAGDVNAYTFGGSAVALLESTCLLLDAVRKDQTEPRTERVFAIFRDLGLRFADLTYVSDRLRKRVVASQMYVITVRNLQVALGIDGAPTIEEVRRKPEVWEFCRTRIDDYTAAMEARDASQPMVLTEAVLLDVINDQHGSWSDDQLRTVLGRTARSAVIEEIEDVVKPAWPMTVAAGLMRLTVANVWDYVQAYGVDDDLARELAMLGVTARDLLEVEKVADGDRLTLAVKLLNASSYLVPAARVQLVNQLEPAPGISVTDVEPGPEQLLARALEEDLFPDDYATFAHFAQGGWDAVSEAFAVSGNVQEFMAPALVAGFVAEFLQDPNIPETLRSVVAENVGTYVPSDDEAALMAAGVFAARNRIRLPLAEVRRIARVTQSPEAVLPHLVRAKEAAPTELAEILASLGEPYKALVAGPDHEFDLPSVPSLEPLLRRLENSGRIAIVQKHIGRGRKVRTLV